MDESKEIQEKKVFKLELHVDELNIILAGLGELPAKASMGVIYKLQEVARQQSDDNEISS